MPRQPEPELIDLPEEVAAYAHADFAQVNAAFAERLIELAGDLANARCVDLGTGPGDIPVRAVRERPGWKIAAVDASQAMLSFARHTIATSGLEEAIEPILADAKSTDLPPSAFDVIFSNSILHHINDTLSLWAEARRLGKPGALVFFRDLFRPPTIDAAREVVHRYADKESPLLQGEYLRSLLASYTPDEVDRQLNVAGLRGFTVEIVTDRHMDIIGRLE